MRTVKLDKENLTFEREIKTTAYGYESVIEPFGQYGLQLPNSKEAFRRHSGDYEVYGFKLNGAIDCFKACVGFAQGVREDQEFCQWI